MLTFPLDATHSDMGQWIWIEAEAVPASLDTDVGGGRLGWLDG